MVLMGEGSEGARETSRSLQGLCTGQTAVGATLYDLFMARVPRAREGEAGWGWGGVGRGSEVSV